MATRKRRPKSATRGKQKRRARPMSRRVLDELLNQLCQRLERQGEVAEALSRAAKPVGETTEASWPMLEVIALATEAHARSLRSATELAKLIAERVSPN